MTTRQRRFVRFAWGLLLYTLLVVAWGAFVRATGSGAGCGDHWPLCNGEVVPREAGLETLIEFSHRLTSGLAGILALVLFGWAFLAWPKGSPVRRAAAWSLGLMVVEAAIGAGLVLFELVAYNVSVGRAYWMAAHLANTFLLLGALTLTAHLAGGHASPRLRAHGRAGYAVLVAIVGTVVVGTSGAIAALGDTLTLGGGLDPMEHPFVATLVGLRIYHPLLALALGLALWGAVRPGSGIGRPAVRRLGAAVMGLYALQIGLGLLNVYLMAPVWLQLVHLLLADALWIALVLFAARRLAAPAPALATR